MTPREPAELVTLRDAVRRADRFLTAGSSFNGYAAPDPIAAHLTLVAALDGQSAVEAPAVLDPSDSCTCGHRRDHHINRDVDDVVGWPCLDCRSKKCRGFASTTGHLSIKEI